MVACLNHGKSSNGRNSSRPSSSSQKPCFEKLVTSTSEVTAPGISNLLLVSRDRLKDAAQVLVAEPMVARRLDPELRFAVGRFHVNVCVCRRSSSREKKKNRNGPSGKTVGLTRVALPAPPQHTGVRRMSG